MELQIGSQEPLYQIMLARYYASSLGRFMAVDPVGGTASNPQSWNRYSCVRNNPLRYTDPTGTSPHGKGSGTMTMLQCSNGKCAQKQVPLPSGMPMHIAHDFKSDKKGEEGKAEVQRAYEMQEQARQNLTDAEKAHYKANYGRDLDEDLTPGHGTTITLTELTGQWDKYNSWTNTSKVDRDALNDGELFGATLLHTTGHFGADMASLFGDARTLVSPDVWKTIHDAVGRNPFASSIHWFEGDAGYAMEVIQYGRVVTLEH